MGKLFSVVTINYNNLQGLKRTVKSVAAQTARNDIEFIVIDGGSTDGAEAWLRESEALFDKLIIEPDKGIYDAMNKGLNQASGDYIWFVNSGDSIYDNQVAQELKNLTKTGPDIIFGDTMFITAEGRELGLISKLKPQPLPKKLGPDSFRFGMNICHQSFLVKRNLAPEYDLQYRQAADIDWIIRILKKRPLTIKAPVVISCFETGGSSYQNEKKAWKERYEVLKKHYGAFPNLLSHAWIFIRRILFNLKLYYP
jgi:glycosyltransferase involved in cell wall biosynthesis